MRFMCGLGTSDFLLVVLTARLRMGTSNGGRLTMIVLWLLSRIAPIDGILYSSKRLDGPPEIDFGKYVESKVRNLKLQVFGTIET